MVQAMCLTNLHYALPLPLIGRRKTSLREDTAFQRTSEEHRTPVYGNLRPLCSQLSKTEVLFTDITACLRIQSYLQGVYIGLEFIPHTEISRHIIQGFHFVRSCTKLYGQGHFGQHTTIASMLYPQRQLAGITLAGGIQTYGSTNLLFIHQGFNTNSVDISLGTGC